MKKIGVYYICTGVYKNWFAGFLESLTNFLPEDEKNVFIISDGLDEYVGFESQNSKVKVKKLDHIHYYPWPIVTLFKFKYILDNKDIDMDYCFYFNANSYVLQRENSYWNKWSDIMVSNDLYVSYHAVNANKKGLNDFIKGAVIRNKKSTSYIKDQSYLRLQAAFFGGNAKAFYTMCEEHLKLLTKDLKNNIIAPAADESYFNKFIFENESKMRVHRQMVIYAEEIGYQKWVEDDIFVKLRCNDAYKDDKTRKDPRNFWVRIAAKLYHTIKH